jgi:hypothetical protein
MLPHHAKISLSCASLLPSIPSEVSHSTNKKAGTEIEARRGRTLRDLRNKMRDTPSFAALPGCFLPDSDRRRRPRDPCFQMQRHQKVSHNPKCQQSDCQREDARAWRLHRRARHTLTSTNLTTSTLPSDRLQEPLVQIKVTIIIEFASSRAWLLYQYAGLESR